MRAPRLNRLAFCVAIVTASIFTRGAFAQDAPATRPAGQDVPVKQVALFSSGVGYFEHTGSVTGDGVTTLRFKTDQINDVLKSLLLEDLDGGKVGTVAYPSAAPLDRTLKSFQVDITDNPPLAALLNQLRGAKVTVQTMEGPLVGTILGVEQEQRVVNEKQVVSEWTLNLRAGRSLQPISLSRVRSLEMDDDKLNHELDDALGALAQSRDQDKKPVDIHFNGQGERRVRIGYVVETPVWKTSYRLVLGGKKSAEQQATADKPTPTTNPASTGMLQGWAIVENQTDTDWNNIELSLISGRPISFITDLYHSLYVPRPYVDSQLYASLQPQTYQNGIGSEELARLGIQRGGNRGQALGQGGGGGIQQSSSLFGNGQSQNAMAPGQGVIDPVASVVASATAEGLGELFQYSVGNVSIKRQQSAMIPIVTDPIAARRVSIYDPSVLVTHPLNGVRIRNSTQKHLLGGPVTVIEAGSYAGDAKIDDLPPGQEKFLSYGIDLKVDTGVSGAMPKSTLLVAKIVRGVMQIQWKDFQAATYVVTNRAAVDRLMVIVHPRSGNWKLSSPAKAEETGQGFDRFVRTVEKNKTLKLEVVSESAREESVQLLPTDVNNLLIYSKFDAISQPVKDALQKITAAKQEVTATSAKIEDHRRRISDITTEQNRMRQNMGAVSQNTDYYTRLIKKLDEQETQIEQEQKTLADLGKQLEAQQKDLQDQINKLNVE